MILREQLTEIGQIHKPHGINGEVSATFDPDIDPAGLRCIVMERDGIFVPFFIDSVRSRNAESVLLTIDGFDSEKAAATLSNAIVYGITAELDREGNPDDPDGEGFYASDLVGFTIVDTEGQPIGRITDLDDRTANYLFVVLRPDGSTADIPVADEYITEIDPARKTLTMDLPIGLI